MKNRTYIISPNNVKDNTSLDANVEDSMIKNNIIISQEIDLQTKLGTDFYEELITQIGDSTLSVENDDFLVKYVQPFLVQQTFYYLIPSVYLKSTNQGLTKMTNAQNATTADLEDVNFMRSGVKDLAEYYLERIERELELNKDKYPTYNDNICSEQNVEPNKNSYFNGIYIPKQK